ncbi:MAG TPA: DNA polymerase III subunit gamma and tau [Micromonosporaceae bacterium]
MALALYRKYRPRTFAEVIGQEHVTEPLMQALRTGRLNHAYLFSGPRGCGKTSSARILARSLNCEKGPTPEPCGECDSCLALAPDGAGSIDVIEIDAASHGGVDDARELRERAIFAPVASRFKVYVIDEAHMVSPQGFNALLKLVEEPPEYVKFVFATTEPEKVLGTIRSRTHHYPFRLIPPSVLRPYLEQLCQREGVSVEPAVFPLVVRAGGGSVRDSLSVLDQLIAGAAETGVTYARAVSLLGVTDVALIDEMTDALAAGDGGAAFATIDRVADAGHDPRRYAADLLERFRDLIVLQQVPDAAASGIIESPADLLERMTSQAARMGPATLSRLADIAHNGLTEMRGTTAPRLLLELIVARMLLPGADDSHAALLQRLERMERRLGAASAGAGEPALVDDTGGAVAAGSTAAPVTAPARSAPAGRTQARATGASASAPASPPVPPASRSSDRSTPSPTQAAPAESPTPAPGPVAADHEPGPPGALDAAAVRRVWDEVLTVVRRRSSRAWAVVREATVRDVLGEEIVLVFQHAVHANMFGAQADLLAEAIQEVLGGTWRVRSELGGDQRGPGPGPAPSGPAGQVAAPARSAPAPDVRRTPPPGQPARSGRGAGAGQGSPSGQSRSTPSGGAGGRPEEQSGDAPSEDDGGDWPTPAQPGGGMGAATADAVAEPAAPARSAGARGAATTSRSGSPDRGNAGSVRDGGRASAPSRTEAAARPAGRGRSGPGARAGTTPAGSAWSDGPPPDEPPFDPDYDRAPAGGRGTSLYEGFDPGDEPLDDGVDPSVARQTSEEQAIRLLSEQLGAERIADPPPRG